MFCLRLNRWWPVRTARIAGCLATATFGLFVAGCGQAPEAEFKFRPGTLDLIPDAQKAVKKSLKDGFGTPQNLVAWQRFPVEFGGVAGVVGEVTAGSNVAEVAFEGDTKQVVKDAPLLWISGARSKDGYNASAVAHFDAETKKLTWSGSVDPAPAPGDKLIVGFGKGLQTGRVVYMRNCMHCHGVSGDGDGPTAKYLNPLPRDYRAGIFKFTSTLTPEKPTRDDLSRIIKYGIPGTYMPSFLWLGETETADVIEYVRWLSMRGEVEKRIDDDLGDFMLSGIEDSFKRADAAWKAAKSDERGEKPSLSKAKAAAKEEFSKYEKDEFAGGVEAAATFIADAWKHGEDAESKIVPTVPRVTDDAESRDRGRRIYLSDKGKCYTCHGVQGRGDGAATEDFWKKPGSDEFYPRRGLHDSWGNPLAPRNLTLGQYRGGRRPVDIFRRVYAGIKGTPMPGFGKTALKDEEIWDVVNFVMSLPYQSTPTKAKAADHVAAKQ